MKLIGDAVMLTSKDPKCLLDAALELVARSEEGGEDFPMLRAGVAYGRVVARGGDFYGRPVNLASRITGWPGREAWSATRRCTTPSRTGTSGRTQERRLKGIDGEQKLFRARLPATATRLAQDRGAAASPERTAPSM